jgi:uncharacterized protein
MIAVDTNLLVYAHREDSEWYSSANKIIIELAEGTSPWAIPWPCIHEFIAIVTHPRIYKPPTPLNKAIDQVDAWLESPSVVMISESETYWENLKHLLANGKITGPRIHDARIAAICRNHGVKEIWTMDRDFNNFHGIKVRNPLLNQF